LIGQQSSIRPTNQGLLSRLPEHLFRSLFSRVGALTLDGFAFVPLLRAAFSDSIRRAYIPLRAARNAPV
jgi:hypothetical protein